MLKKNNRMTRPKLAKFFRGMYLVALTSVVLCQVALSQDQLTKPKMSKLRVAIFFEPTFPAVDFAPVARESLQSALEGDEVVFLSLSDLNEQLGRHQFDVFVNPYGSAFPREGWGSVYQYLAAGGNWVNLGGIPFSVPVGKEGDHWRQEVRQTQFHKQLLINQAFPVAAGRLNSYRSNEALDGANALLDQFQAEEIYELYVRFTTTVDYPSEGGSGGARDAQLRSLVYGLGNDGRRLAAPFIQIDRLQGPFAGGRWMLANFKGTISTKAIRALVNMAAQGSMEFVVRPSYACYYGGESPSFTVRLRMPKGDVEAAIKGDCQIEVIDQKSRSVGKTSLKLNGAASLATGYLDAPFKQLGALAPGFYQVNASVDVSSQPSTPAYTLHYTTGFWVFDRQLLAGGKPFTVNKDYLLRDGQPYPITGTTYMASDVHRKYLFEPNPYVWDQDFAEMKKAGINMVRTGIWTGWKNFMLDPGAPNEAPLRALDAFLLTARRYDIPVIFTLFAFLPEQWGGVNPYFDPRSVSAQKEFVSAFSRRYREMNDLIWDFINEPSFSSPQHIWSCRPNYDAYETSAWNRWIGERFASLGEKEQQARLQEQWRELPWESTGLPRLDDFNDQQNFYDKRPVKAFDYRLFAQEMFNRWVREMTTAIRGGGNQNQLITVGQDEGGLADRPNPQFYGDVVDFTCNHTWWLNDDLLWDSLMAKSPAKPNLIEETGIMFFEKIDGSAWRTEEEARNLLERKLALALGANGAGVIQWVWNTNVYMTSDNEVAIGFYRADGTAKPELEPMLAISPFIRQHAQLFTDKQDEDVLMVIPHSEMFSVRDFATAATKRAARVMHYHCNTPMRAAGEYAIGKQPDTPKLIVLPSPRVFNQQAWETLLALVDRGSTLLLTGAINNDEHWLPVERLQQLGLATTIRPVVQEESLLIDGQEYHLSYRGDKIQKLDKAVVGGGVPPQVKVITHGQGTIIWSPLPVELSDSIEPTVALYNFALKQANIKPIYTVEKSDPSVLIRPTLFSTAVLYTLVSESSQDKEIRFIHNETQAPISVKIPAQRTVLLIVDRKSGRVLGREGA